MTQKATKTTTKAAAKPQKAAKPSAKKATKARKGVNPFTGEEMMFKAKPASKKVRVLALKQLKAMVN